MDLLIDLLLLACLGWDSGRTGLIDLGWLRKLRKVTLLERSFVEYDNLAFSTKREVYTSLNTTFIS